MPSSFIEFVITEAASRGFRTERIPAESKRHAFDKRLLLIEGRRCQIIPSRPSRPSAQYPNAEYLPLYLPRTDWADFLVYVSVTQNQPVFHIVPRAEMSKDTGRAPESLAPFKDAWELLQLDLPEGRSEKEFEIFSWQLHAVKLSAQRVGLEVEFIKTKKHKDGKRWPPFIKRRVIIAGRKCAVFSATRLSQNPEKRSYNYAVFKVPMEKWPEFVVYVAKETQNSWHVFVVPRGHVSTWTTASLDHPELARYRNAWKFLTATPESLSAIPPIQWKEPSIHAPPTKHAIILQEAIRKAESHGLITDSALGHVHSFKGVQNFIYVNKKPCQVIQAKVLMMVTGEKSLPFVALSPPKSEWAKFLIFYSQPLDDSESAKFYIIPREMLTRATSRSLQSKWLKGYEDAWSLLR
jgi:hypothetical protein